LLGALAWLLLGGRRAAATSTSKKAASALDDVSKLQARANQNTAQNWIPDLIAAGASPDLAHALARWIGVESSGDPSKPSPIGEWGLLQIEPATAKAALTPAEWAELQNPKTSRAEHARIALKQFMWHRDRAAKYLAKKPAVSAWDNVFYAKLHHERPKDLSDARRILTGNARKDLDALTAKYRNDPAALHRLASAAVVTWGTVTP
jgi:hypothetical protein